MGFDLNGCEGWSSSLLRAVEEIGNIKNHTLIQFVICFSLNVSPLQHFHVFILCLYWLRVFVSLTFSLNSTEQGIHHIPLALVRPGVRPALRTGASSRPSAEHEGGDASMSFFSGTHGVLPEKGQGLGSKSPATLFGLPGPGVWPQWGGWSPPGLSGELASREQH